MSDLLKPKPCQDEYWPWLFVVFFKFGEYWGNGQDYSHIACVVKGADVLSVDLCSKKLTKGRSLNARYISVALLHLPSVIW